MRWVIFFAVMALGGIAIVLLALWVFSGFRDLGLDAAGTVAIVFGILVTSLLGVGLMALIFYSDRSDRDDEVYHVGRTSPDDRPEPTPGAKS
jgi:hypothetical protein